MAIALLFMPYYMSSATAAGGNRTSRLYIKAKKYLEHDEYNHSLDCFLKYITAEEATSPCDTARLMDAYYNVGGIYSVYSDFAQALEVYKKGYRLSLASHSEEMQFKFLNNMVGSGCNIKMTDMADSLNEKVIRLKGIDEGKRTYYYYFNKGFISGSRGDNEGKARWMEKSIETVDKYRMPGDMKVYAYSELYLCYENQGRMTDALAALHKYDSLARIIDQAYMRADCYKGMMRIYTKIGDKEKALYYQSEYFRYVDSLMNVNEFSQIRTNYITGERQRADNTISNLERMNSLQQTVLLMLGLIVLTAVGAVIAVYRQRQKLYATNVELFKRNGELLEAESKYRKSLEISAVETAGKLINNTCGQSAGGFDHDELLKKILEVMENEDVFCSPDFSLPVLARLTESNTNYVSQTINSTFGKNFRSFVNEYRIKVAMKRIMDNGRYSNYSIQGIAESVGYKSASNFIAAFKKFTGMTPSLYQKISKTTE